jgi:hypothetical protein
MSTLTLILTHTRYRASATVQQIMSTCVEKEMTINSFTLFVERKLTSPGRSLSNFDEPPYNRLCQFVHDTDTDTPSHTYVHICHRTTGCEHMCLKGKRRYCASFVERKSTSPRKSVSNSDTDTDSTTHDWDREAVYENQRCSSWLEQDFRYSSSLEYRSRYNRTVCRLG